MAITRGLISLTEARDAIFGAQAGTAPTGRDSTIEDYVEAATPVIEGLPGIGPQYAESRTYTLNGYGTAGVLMLPVKFNTVTSVTVDGVATTAYKAAPSAGLIYAGSDGFGSWGVGVRNIVVVVTVGSATIPPHVQLAARELVRHWWQQGQQGNRPSFGDGSSDPAVAFGVPTRRLMELLGSGDGVAGFA